MFNGVDSSASSQIALRQHNKFLVRTFCFTNDLKHKNRVGYAFSIRNQISLHHHRNTPSIHTAELQAIFHCLTTIFDHLFSHSYLIMSDSLSSLTAFSNPKTPVHLSSGFSFFLYPAIRSLPSLLYSFLFTKKRSSSNSVFLRN